MVIPQEVKAEIIKYTNDAKSGSKVISSVTAVMDLLERHHRDGVGVSVSEVHSLIDDILAVGFSKEEAGKCVCIEVGAADAHIRDFNDRLSAMSNGKLGNLQPQTHLLPVRI